MGEFGFRWVALGCGEFRWVPVRPAIKIAGEFPFQIESGLAWPRLGQPRPRLLPSQGITKAVEVELHTMQKPLVLTFQIYLHVGMFRKASRHRSFGAVSGSLGLALVPSLGRFGQPKRRNWHVKTIEDFPSKSKWPILASPRCRLGVAWNHLGAVSGSLGVAFVPSRGRLE